MAFIDKKDPVVLNIKITSKGRETLSKGHLHFKYFAIGDSEIDYDFIRNAATTSTAGSMGSAGSSVVEYNPFNSKILRPADKNPNLISFITKSPLTENDLLDEFAEQNQYTVIDSVPSIAWEVENTAESIGFFNENAGNFEFKVTEEFIKQPDLMLNYSSIVNDIPNKKYQVLLEQAPTYGANRNNPKIGDYLLVRWKEEDADFDTTGYIINKEKAAPILIYKIVDVDGDIQNNAVKVWVDRPLPNFIADIYVGAMILYFNTTLNIEQQFSTDYASEALLTFLQNCQCDTLVFPFWKLSIIYAENVAGVKTTNKQLGQHASAPYGGFINYIQNHAPTYKKLGVIHYTNVSPANVYAEQFLRRTPTLHLPTIMWHKSSGSTVGLTLKAVGDLKTVTSNDLTPSLNVSYYDLADGMGNVVGKVFTELKIFVIEDQELLFAMSYKSNRSWTLPNFSVGANDSITDCPTCTGQIIFNATPADTTALGGNDGTITINNIGGLIYAVADKKSYLKVEKISGGTGINYSAVISGETTVVTGLSAGTYKITILDLGGTFTNDCESLPQNVVIKDPQWIAIRSTDDELQGSTDGIGEDNLK